MKKKLFLSIVAMTVALVTSLSVPTTAYATSVTTTTEIAGVSRTADDASPAVLGARRDSANGEGVNTSKVTDPNALESISNLENVAIVISTGANVAVSGNELTVVDVMEINAQAGTVVSPENPLYITFNFPGITASSEVYILHYSNGVWSVIPTTVYDGSIVGMFTSLSPVAIVTRTSTLNGAVKGAKKSPRTGDDRYLILIACGAALALAGSASLKKRFS